VLGSDTAHILRGGIAHGRRDPPHPEG